MEHRLCVVFEEYDCYGNQGIGTDVVSARDIGDAYDVVLSYLAETIAMNPDEITDCRVIGITLLPDLKGAEIS